MEYNKFFTGDEIRLNNLFSKNNVIIIPDLQRDYCWGTEDIKNAGNKNKTLAGAFVDNLINNGYKKSQMNLGLLYGYEAPAGHIQLCDGQQRITTLFLLLGILNKRSKNSFQEYLISSFEYFDDDHEPYLQYSIRESSLYFLSDLVCEFFLKNDNVSANEIYHQNWYFKDYDLDPSIQSMIQALITIESLISEIDPKSFGEYLIKEVTFMYYDMESRESGEETFVIINTTGEPLTATENLKPLYFIEREASQRQECCNKWEEWENWFWRHRKGSGNKQNDTAENGFKEFLRWITLLNTPSETKRIQETGNFTFDVSISVNTIDQYFNIVKAIFYDDELYGGMHDWLAPDTSDKNQNTQLVWFRLLPVIEYIRIWGDKDKRNILRVFKFFNNLSRIDRVSKAIGQILPIAIDVIKNLKDADIAKIKDQQISTQILTEEEKLKFEIYLTANTSIERCILEDTFWKVEEHKIWSGEIRSILNWASSSGTFNLTLFNQYNDVFNKLFYGKLDYESLDITRRALLTLNLNGYPRIFRGNTNFNFCYEYSDWQALIYENEASFGQFLYYLFNKNIETTLESMIVHYPDTAKWAEFIKIKELLGFCSNKNAQYYNDLGWILIKGDKRSGEHANLRTYRLYLDLKTNPSWNNNWILGFYTYEGSSVHFKKSNEHIDLDIIYRGNDLFRLELFNKKDNNDLNLVNFSNKNNLKFYGERYYSIDLTRGDTIQLLTNILSIL